MTANELCRDCGFTLLCCGDREVTGGVYCCDLLSMVMGRAPTDGVWFTVMANQNTMTAPSILARVLLILEIAFKGKLSSHASCKERLNSTLPPG